MQHLAADIPSIFSCRMQKEGQWLDSCQADRLGLKQHYWDSTVSSGFSHQVASLVSLPGKGGKEDTDVISLNVMLSA